MKQIAYILALAIALPAHAQNLRYLTCGDSNTLINELIETHGVQPYLIGNHYGYVNGSYHTINGQTVLYTNEQGRWFLIGFYENNTACELAAGYNLSTISD